MKKYIIGNYFNMDDEVRYASCLKCWVIEWKFFQDVMYKLDPRSDKFLQMMKY